MGIPISGGGKGRRRRSYADYKPPNRHRRPRNDPFRVIFYLALIAGTVWIYFNRDRVVKQFVSHPIEVVERPTPTRTPTLDPTEFVTQAQEAYLNGRLDEAIEYYRQAASYASNEVEYPFQMARLLLYRSGLEYGTQREVTLDEAYQAANRAILADPERPEGYAIIGKVLDWQGDPAKASSQILRALEIDENFAEGHAYLAEALVDRDLWDQATESIQRALELDPDNVDIRRDYAYVLEKLGDYAGAATQYEMAIQLHPNLPNLYMALGRVYRTPLVGRYYEALDQFFEVEALQPQNALIPFEIGLTYETYIGDPNTALGNYERAIDLDAEFVLPWIRIGAIRYFQGSYIQAVPALERALELGAENIEIYYQLGISYAQQGKCVEAMPYLREAQNRSQGDERILDIVQEGFDLCADLALTIVPTATTGSTP